MPRSIETPTVEMFLCEDCPGPLNPFGVRGAGEVGMTIEGAAIGAAVDDALWLPGLVDCFPIGLGKLHAMVSIRLIALEVDPERFDALRPVIPESVGTL
jgi:hypothetical protein